jgi:hypothetical protein
MSTPSGKTGHEATRRYQANSGSLPPTSPHVLNQSEGGSRVTPIYARHDFSEEKRVALEAWGRHLDALLTGHTPARVVPFRQ